MRSQIERQRVLPVRRRPDLILAPRPTRHGRWWTVKDPLSLRYCQLRDEELFVLERLDGETPVASILDEFAQRFAPSTLEVEELIGFVHSLSQQGLITTSNWGATTRTTTGRTARGWKTLWRWFSNPLAIRFRGIDPQALLDLIHPRVRWMFSRQAIAVYVLLVFAALLLLGSRWEMFQMRLPAMTSILGAGNVVSFIAAFAVVKVLHELGHALACRHFGGECRELGVMLLAFIPCLYCNVSDAWLLPNRWHRIAVSFAGICVELVLAAICTFLWWYSEPGTLHSVCFSVMFVASVGTLLLNGNPLLRYDGYYVLSDLLEIPNLRHRAMTACRRLFAHWLFGVSERGDGFISKGWNIPLALFGAASGLYLWIVLIVILKFVDQALEPLGMRPFVVLLAVLVIGGRMVATSRAASRRIRSWSASGLIQPARFGFGVLVSGGLLVAVLLIPLPHRIAAPFVVSIRNSRNVYVTVPGYLADGAHESGARYGDLLSAGDTITILESHELNRDIVRLEGECHRRRTVIDTLRLRQFVDRTAATELRSMEAELADYEGRLAQRVSDRDALTLSAPVDGLFLRPSEVAPPDAIPLDREGVPLDDRNQRAYLETGTVVGIVGTPGRFDAVLAVDQVDIPYVRQGQEVRLRLPQLGRVVAVGTVEEIAARELEVSPSPLVQSNLLPSRIDDDGTIRPVDPVYEVRVALSNVPEVTIIGATGEARVEVGSMTLARRIIRLFESTFVSDR